MPPLDLIPEQIPLVQLSLNVLFSSKYNDLLLIVILISQLASVVPPPIFLQVLMCWVTAVVNPILDIRGASGGVLSIYTFTAHSFVLPALSSIVIVSVLVSEENFLDTVLFLQPLLLSLHPTVIFLSLFVQLVLAPVIVPQLGATFSML